MDWRIHSQRGVPRSQGCSSQPPSRRRRRRSRGTSSHGRGRLERGSIAARAAPRRRGPAVGWAARLPGRAVLLPAAAAAAARCAFSVRQGCNMFRLSPPPLSLGGRGGNRLLPRMGARKGQGEGGGVTATLRAEGSGGEGTDRTGLLRSLSGRIQWEHSVRAAGLFEMRRADGRGLAFNSAQGIL